MGEIMLTVLFYILVGLLLLLGVLQIHVFLNPEEDKYSDRAIRIAKARRYPSNLSYEKIMNYKIHERVAILGVNNFKELYEQYPEYLRDVEKRHIENIGFVKLKETNITEKASNMNGSPNFQTPAAEKFLEMSLEERMEILGVGDYTEMCKNYPEYVTHEEFRELLKQGQIRSADDIICFQGRYYENEFSEDWEDFEYEYDKDHR